MNVRNLLCFLALSVSPAFSGVVLSFTQTPFPGAPGATVKFFGTLTNTDSFTNFINSDSLNFTGVGFSADDTPFFVHAPLFLSPNSVSSLFEVVDVTIPLSAAVGTYAGALAIVGGASPNAQDIIGQATFAVQVIATAPEPGTLAMLAFGGITIFLKRRNLA